HDVRLSRELEDLCLAAILHLGERYEDMSVKAATMNESVKAAFKELVTQALARQSTHVLLVLLDRCASPPHSGEVLEWLLDALIEVSQKCVHCRLWLFNHGLINRLKSVLSPFLETSGVLHTKGILLASLAVQFAEDLTDSKCQSAGVQSRATQLLTPS